jgi:hypothetical protein
MQYNNPAAVEAFASKRYLGLEHRGFQLSTRTDQSNTRRGRIAAKLAHEPLHKPLRRAPCPAAAPLPNISISDTSGTLAFQP